MFEKGIRIGKKEFDIKNQTYIMGILNVTPDSFSDGGRYEQIDNALRQVEKMLSEGAAIIDVGGESTRPGYTLISDEEEIKRVVPVVEAIRARFDTVISVDTYKSKVADAAILAGADMINDIWGLKYDDKMAQVIAKHGVSCCLMHNRSDSNYSDFMEDVLTDLKESVAIAKKAQISDDKILIDPGVGFAKSYENNLSIIKNIGCLHEVGYPILLGASRKSVIGLTLDLQSDERVEGTLVTTVYAVQQHCAFVRVHDIKENERAIRMTKALMSEGIMLL